MGNLKNRQKRIGRPGRRRRLTQQLVDYWTRRKEEINNPQPPEPPDAYPLNLVGKNNNLDRSSLSEEKTESESDRNQCSKILEYIQLCDKKHPAGLRGEAENEQVSHDNSNCDKSAMNKKQRSRKMSNPRRRVHLQLNISHQLLKQEPEEVTIKEEIPD